MGGTREAHYIAALAEAMPGERVVPFRDLTADQRKAVEIAVVANPDPADVAALPRLVWLQSLWAGVERLVAADRGLRTADRAPGRSGDGPDHGRVRPRLDLLSAARHARLSAAATIRRPGVNATTANLPGRRSVCSGSARWAPSASDRLVQAGFDDVAAWSRSPKMHRGGHSTATTGSRKLLAGSDIVVLPRPIDRADARTPERATIGGDEDGRSTDQISRGDRSSWWTTSSPPSMRASSRTLSSMCFDEEPLPVSSSLWRHPRITVIPHISAPTNMRTAAAVVANNVLAYRRTGRVPDRVDISRGY